MNSAALFTVGASVAKQAMNLGNAFPKIAKTVQAMGICPGATEIAIGQLTSEHALNNFIQLAFGNGTKIDAIFRTRELMLSLIPDLDLLREILGPGAEEYMGLLNQLKEVEGHLQTDNFSLINILADRIPGRDLIRNLTELTDLAKQAKVDLGIIEVTDRVNGEKKLTDANGTPLTQQNQTVDASRNALTAVNNDQTVGVDGKQITSTNLNTATDDVTLIDILTLEARLGKYATSREKSVLKRAKKEHRATGMVSPQTKAKVREIQHDRGIVGDTKDHTKTTVVHRAGVTNNAAKASTTNGAGGNAVVTKIKKGVDKNLVGLVKNALGPIGLIISDEFITNLVSGATELVQAGITPAMLRNLDEASKGNGLITEDTFTGIFTALAKFTKKDMSTEEIKSAVKELFANYMKEKNRPEAKPTTTTPTQASSTTSTAAAEPAKPTTQSIDGPLSLDLARELFNKGVQDKTRNELRDLFTEKDGQTYANILKFTEVFQGYGSLPVNQKDSFHEYVAERMHEITNTKYVVSNKTTKKYDAEALTDSAVEMVSRELCRQNGWVGICWSWIARPFFFKNAPKTAEGELALMNHFKKKYNFDKLTHAIGEYLSGDKNAGKDLNIGQGFMLKTIKFAIWSVGMLPPELKEYAGNLSTLGKTGLGPLSMIPGIGRILKWCVGPLAEMVDGLFVHNDKFTMLKAIHDKYFDKEQESVRPASAASTATADAVAPVAQPAAA